MTVRPRARLATVLQTAKDLVTIDDAVAALGMDRHQAAKTLALWQPLKSAFLFVWGAGDPAWLLMTKRLFLLMPLGAVALGYWTSVLSIPTIIVRAKRRAFISQVLVTWWDLARATFTFWGGVFRFLLQFVISLFGAIQMLVVGVWAVLQELIVLPFRLIKDVSSNMLNPGVPWIAVVMTFFWCVFEAIIFTYVMTSLVIDTLSNIAGTQLTETGIRIPLFLFMLFIALGSYAVLSSFTDAIKSRDWMTVIKIGVVESVALFVEVVFLYREFVDALVPWFAQHASHKFDLGIGGTLLIASWLTALSRTQVSSSDSAATSTGRDSLYFPAPSDSTAEVRTCEA